MLYKKALENENRFRREVVDESSVKKAIEVIYRNPASSYLNKRQGNSFRYIQMGLVEVEKMEDTYKKFSSIEKNRMALKFVQMNSNLSKFSFLERYACPKQLKLEINNDTVTIKNQRIERNFGSLDSEQGKNYKRRGVVVERRDSG